MNVWYGLVEWFGLRTNEGPVPVQYVKAPWWPEWITITLN